MEKPKSEKHIAPASDKVTKVPFNDASSKPEKGTLVSKKNTQAGDPSIKDAAHRSAKKATSGARYGIRVKFQKQEAPEAGATLSEGRLFPPAKGNKPNFSAGTVDHN